MRRILGNTYSILNRKERQKLFQFIFMNVIISIIDIASLVFLLMLISIYSGTDLSGKFDLRYQWLTDRNSMLPVSLFVILFTIKSLIGYWVFVSQYRYVYNVAARISEFNLKRYLEGSFSDFVNVDSSVQIRKILHQPIEFCHYILISILSIATESILSAITLITILLFNFQIFLLLSCVLVPPVIILTYIRKKTLKQARLNAKINSEKTLQYLQEGLSGFVESNIFDKSRFFTGRFVQYQKQMTRFLGTIQTSQGIPPRLIEGFAVAGLFIIIFSNKLSGNSYLIGFINIGAFMAAAYKIIPGIVKIMNASGQIKTYHFVLTDLVNNKKQNTGKGNDPGKPEVIILQNINFAHHKISILENFNFQIRKSDFIGISGLSGKGKTTLINLILGFLEPDSGTILINDKPVTQGEIQQYWKYIAYVQQRPFLIHDTIRTNITLDEDNIDEEKLQEVIINTGLNELLLKSAEGLDKIVAENGRNISGGQKQRIAIARALYKNADLIILDEPFSELDRISEQKLLEYLKTLATQGKMIILNTHKNENLIYCNKTYVIN